MLIATLTACGGGDISLDELADEIADTVCDRYVACGHVEDAKSCRDIMFESGIDPDLVAAVEAGKVIYHSDKARECLDSLRGSCERTGHGIDSTACDALFEGTVGAGGQCAMDQECISQECDVPRAARARASAIGRRCAPTSARHAMSRARAA